MAEGEIFSALIAVIKSENLPDSPVEISNRRAPSNYSQSPRGARLPCNPFPGRRAFNCNSLADFPDVFNDSSTIHAVELNVKDLRGGVATCLGCVLDLQPGISNRRNRGTLTLRLVARRSLVT